MAWEAYKEFLKDLLQDPVMRAYTTSVRYWDARQRPGQTVIQFVTHFDELEGELAPYSDEQRYWHLLSKSSPEARSALDKFQDLPDTRDGLIALARRLEANLPRNFESGGEPLTAPQQDSDPKKKGKTRGARYRRKS